MEDSVKGMHLTVYYNDGYRTCANGGMSETAEQILLVSDPDSGTEVPEVFDDCGKYPVCRLIDRGNLGMVIVPEEIVTSDKWSMFGGNFAYTSDSRIRQIAGDRPIPIHDRIER